VSKLESSVVIFLVAYVNLYFLQVGTGHESMQKPFPYFQGQVYISVFLLI